jgi:SHS2 domain-containing protein
LNVDFEYFDHTADIGVKAYGESLEALFQNAALGLVSIVYETSYAPESRTFDISVDNPDDNLEQILVDWLNEVLFILETEAAVLTRFDIRELDGRHIRAMAAGSPSGLHRYKTEVKSVTYHMLEIGREKDLYFARVLFDI